MISFRKMTQSEFKIFAQWSIKDYAKELVKSGNQSLEKSLIESETEFNEMLPNGLNSKDNYLYVIQNEELSDVGMIWYQKHLHKPEIAFIGEFIIKEEFRKHGYGKDALKKVAEDAKEKNYNKMGLSVFKFNKIAYSLYLKCGFEVVEIYEGNMIMEKLL